MIGRIGDVFDLDTLVGDYREIYEPWPDAIASVEQELDKIRWRNVSDYLSFAVLEADVPGIMNGTTHPAGEYARTGLLLGYPVASTVVVVSNSMRTWFNCMDTATN